ncbi:Glycosyl transferase, family 2 [Meiothermus ruber H328]|nr:Glycosyl transferase, family 2 [Meiothermus ruber H328]
MEAKGFILTYENHLEPGWKKGFFYKAGGHMKEDLSALGVSHIPNTYFTHTSYAAELVGGLRSR